MNGFYSIFNSSGKKIADCGSLQDAITLVTMKGDGHYYQFTPYPGDIVDVSFDKQLPTTNLSGPIYERIQQEYLESMYPDVPENSGPVVLPEGEGQPVIV